MKLAAMSFAALVLPVNTGTFALSLCFDLLRTNGNVRLGKHRFKRHP